MKLSLTGIKNPSIWARTHFGSSDHAFRLAVENIVASAAKPNKFVDIAKERGGGSIMFLSRAGS